jgi:hypothetical protein
MDPLLCAVPEDNITGPSMGEKPAPAGPPTNSGTGSAQNRPDEDGGRPIALILPIFRRPAGLSRACASGGLVARIGPPVGAILADSPDPGMLP